MLYRPYVWFSALLVTGLLVFSTGWSTPFVLDAVNKIESNPDIRRHNFQLNAFFDAYSAAATKGTHLRSDPSRPWTYMLYWALWQIDDGRPWPFHVCATLLHIFTAFLLGRWAYKLGWPPAAALATSFLFLLLPLSAGSVLYPSALSDLLAAAATLLVLNLVLAPATHVNVLAVVLAYLFALGAKQSAVVIPALVLPLARDRRLLALAVLTAGYLMMRAWYFGGIGDLEAESTFGAGEYLLVQGAMIWRYLALAVWPFGLTVDHAVQPSDVPQVWQVIAWLALMLVAGVALRRRWSLLAAALFLLPLLPTSSVLPTTDLLVERRAYLAMGGWAMALTMVFSRSRWGLPVIAALIAAYGVRTVIRAHEWNSGAEAIYSEVLRLYPKDPRSLNNLAVIHINQGQLDVAKSELESVLKTDGRNVDALANLASIYQLRASPYHSPAQAVVLYRMALTVDPQHLNSWRNLGWLYLALNQVPEAKAAFTQALALQPRLAVALAGLGKAEQLSGNVAAAVKMYQAALAEEPDLALAREELARLPH